MDHHINSRSWEHILFFLRRERGIHTKQEHPLRLFVEAVWYMARSGSQWLSIMGPRDQCTVALKRWSDAGIRERLTRCVSDLDMASMMLDATIVRTHARSAGYGKDTQEKEALGRRKGGFITTIHACVDALGNPIRFTLTPGQRHDTTQAQG